MFDRKSVQAERIAQQMTVEDLAVAAGVSERQMFRYLASVEPPLSVAVLIGRRLGMPLDSLYVHEIDASPHSAGALQNDQSRDLATRR